MEKALAETDVKPVSEPRIEFLEEENRHGYKMECEIVPEVRASRVRGHRSRGRENQGDATKRWPSGLRPCGRCTRRWSTDLPGRPPKRAISVIIRYEAFDDGKPVKGVKADAYPLDLGSANLMPEFENVVTGMKAGEEKEAEINFRADYPDKDIAGKTLLFKVLVKEVKEKKTARAGRRVRKRRRFRGHGRSCGPK